MGVKYSSIEALASSMGMSVTDVEKKIKGSIGGKAATKIRDAEKPKFTVFPPLVPQAILYRALVKKYGRFFEEGEVLYELQNVLPDRKFEADIALPRFKVAIEMDGWRSHGMSKAGFKRDREKWLLFATYGWLVIPISREQIIDDLTNVVELIDKCVQQRSRIQVSVIDKKNLVGAIFKGEII